MVETSTPADVVELPPFFSVASSGSISSGDTEDTGDGGSSWLDVSTMSGGGYDCDGAMGDILTGDSDSLSSTGCDRSFAGVEL